MSKQTFYDYFELPYVFSKNDLDNVVKIKLQHIESLPLHYYEKTVLIKKVYNLKFIGENVIS